MSSKLSQSFEGIRNSKELNPQIEFPSDEDRFFIPRIGGWFINLKYIARKLGWVKTQASPQVIEEEPDSSPETANTAEDRLRRSYASSVASAHGSRTTKPANLYLERVMDEKNRESAVDLVQRLVQDIDSPKSSNQHSVPTGTPSSSGVL